MKLKPVLIFIFSIVVAILVYKFFKLILTLPLLVVGLGLFFVQSACGRKSSARLIVLNISFILTGVAVVLSALNLLYLFESPSRKLKTSYEGDYGATGTWIKKENAFGLGYMYKPGLQDHRSRKFVLADNEHKKVLIYDVLYNITSNSNRLVPESNVEAKGSGNAILFIGDSLTFGEGLNDDETLSYYLQDLLRRPALNAGMHGYGAHQSLRILEDDKLYEAKTNGLFVTDIIYRAIPGHVNRSAGYSPWDQYGPCYEIDKYGEIKYRGSFIDCDKSSRGFTSKIVNRLASSNEPFTVSLFRRFTLLGKYSNKNYSSHDIERFLAITRKMEKISTERGANFYLIFEDSITHGVSCGAASPFSDVLSGRLKQQHKNLILTSNVYTKDVCLSNNLTISKHDRHPTSAANQILAQFISANRLLN